MDFKEFYKLLNEAITKEKTDIKPTSENYNTYLFNRYLSFYVPEIAVHIAKTTNKLGFIPEENDEEMSFNCIKAILPKLPMMYIDYIKKPAVVASQEYDFDEDEIFLEAKLNECSKREIRNLILDYAKRIRKREIV